MGEHAWDKAKFLEYDNLVALGEIPFNKGIVTKCIGEHKCLYTPEKDQVYFLFLVKSDNFPEWATADKFTLLKVT